MKTIIIDDEILALKALEDDITTHCPELDIVSICTKSEEAIEQINHHKPELVFTDIQMPRMNAFTMLNQLNWKNFELIFVSAYNKYAVRAFEFSAIDYIVKPVDVNKLIKAVHKVKTKKSNEALEQKLSLIIHNMKFNNQDNYSLAIPTSYGLEFVEVKNLVHIQANNNYSDLYFADGKKIVVSKTLKHFCDILCDYQFIRIHQSHLVNSSFIKSFYKGAAGSVKLKDGTVLPISRSQKKAVSNFFLGK